LNFLDRFPPPPIKVLPDIEREGIPSSETRANGQKDMAKLTGALRHYAKASKIAKNGFVLQSPENNRI